MEKIKLKTVMKEYKKIQKQYQKFSLKNYNPNKSTQFIPSVERNLIPKKYVKKKSLILDKGLGENLIFKHMEE